MSQKTVSIIVPTYNQSRYISTCLDAIFFQDYPNLEIIVVNDGSTDGTRELLEEYLESIESEEVSFAAYYNVSIDKIERTWHRRYAKQGRIFKVIHNKTNFGSTRAYNVGFKTATGEYCTYIASDDICHPQMISTLAKPLDIGIADFVYSDMFIVDDDGRILREFKLPDFSFKACFQDWYLCGVSKLYRTSLHYTIGFYDERYLANDHELYLRFAMNSVRFKHIANTLYSVRSHDKREVNVHNKSNWSRLLIESCELVEKARAHQK